MRRRLAWLVVLFVGLGLLGACSGDEGDDDPTTTADLEGRPGSETGGGSDGEADDGAPPAGDGVVAPEVEAFCAEVDQYVELIGQVEQDALAVDPDVLEERSQALRDASDAVNESADQLDEEDAAGTQECTQRLSEAGGVLAP